MFWKFCIRGSKFYGPGGPYASLLGKDASIPLATDTLSFEQTNQEMNEKQKQRLEEWTSFFEKKYSCIGTFQ